MLKRVTDDQYEEFIKRLFKAVNDAQTYQELQKLQPSLIMAQRQATTSHRAFRILCVLQDFNHKSRCLGVCV